jgi:hypothetical protein
MSLSRGQSATTVASSLAPRARDGDSSTGRVISVSIYNVQALKKGYKSSELGLLTMDGRQ